jgi:hypothetical protein
LAPQTRTAFSSIARKTASSSPDELAIRRSLVGGRLPLQGFAELTLRMCETAFEITTRFLRHRVVQPPAVIRGS